MVTIQSKFYVGCVSFWNIGLHDNKSFFQRCNIFQTYYEFLYNSFNINNFAFFVFVFVFFVSESMYSLNSISN